MPHRRRMGWLARMHLQQRRLVHHDPLLRLRHHLQPRRCGSRLRGSIWPGHSAPNNHHAHGKSKPMIRLDRVTRAYPGGVLALDAVSLDIASHEFVAVTGPSGCGKSTLMHLIAGLDKPTSGEVHVDGLALHRAADNELTAYRRRSLGIVFQFFNLL